MPDQTESQYAAAARVPLIKSPGLRVPPPVRSTSSSSTTLTCLQVHLPPDIHPLPDSVTPYFVYPYTLEPHILTVESSRRTTLAAHTARREAYLHAREDEREWRRKEALRRVAPGFDPAATLVPVRAEAGEATKIDVMDQLVDQLARMENDS
ncbi:hypothetical protein EV702DRAFT_1087326 [Suillus placidus]|uniref:Uncharacterized protein n=1 Tax=Suillus placidus TaxID=48579 RepID=A0A9P6ZYS7_9AGAM|nr:hypothetical protein EV702DRAFT_1087326 [Suillus placidus]